MHILAGRKRLIAGLSLGVASAAVLVFAIVVIVSSAVSDDLDLPSDGSLAEILEEDSPSINFGAVAADTPEIVAVPQGPLPVRVDIRNIFIDAPVITLGVGEDTIPEVPQRPDQIAWYNFSATPGQNSNAVFSGHVDWQTSGGDPIPGVFYRLREVRIGDAIVVTWDQRGGPCGGDGIEGQGSGGKVRHATLDACVRPPSPCRELLHGGVQCRFLRLV